MSNSGTIFELHWKTIAPSSECVFHQLMKLACVQIPADSKLMTTLMGLMLIFQLIAKADFLTSLHTTTSCSDQRGHSSIDTPVCNQTLPELLVSSTQDHHAQVPSKLNQVLPHPNKPKINHFCQFHVQIVGFLNNMPHSFGDKSIQDGFVVRFQNSNQLAPEVKTDRKTSEDDSSCSAANFLATVT